MAGPATKALVQSHPRRRRPLAEAIEVYKPENGKVEVEQNDVQLAAARLYGLGYKRSQITRILLDHLAPKERPNGQRDRTKEEQEVRARNKLRTWERSDKFRDLLYKHAVVALDLETPEILQSVARQAKRGKIDAAKFALEVTGRHNPRGDQAPPEITVNIANIPRP
jgi:hypothetical protein